MTKLEANRMGWRTRARLLAGGAALVSALALATPALAGASTYSPFTITQNTAMIVNVSPPSPTTALGTVSWGDVSWADSYCF